MDIFSVVNQIQISSGSNQEVLPDNSLPAEQRDGDFRSALNKANSEMESKDVSNDEAQSTDKPSQAECSESEMDNKNSQEDTAVQANTDKAGNKSNTADEVPEEAVDVVVVETIEQVAVVMGGTANQTTDAAAESAQAGAGTAVNQIDAANQNNQANTTAQQTEQIVQADQTQPEQVKTELNNEVAGNSQLSDEIAVDTAEISDEELPVMTEQKIAASSNEEIKTTPEIKAQPKEAVSQELVNTAPKEQTPEGTGNKLVDAIENPDNFSPSKPSSTTLVGDSSEKTPDNNMVMSDKMPDIEQVDVTNNAQDVKSVDSSGTVTSSQTPQSAERASSIANQINESIQSVNVNETKQIVVRLHPAELGRVTIKFHQQDNQLVGVLEVDKAQTKYDLERAMPELAKNLAQAGLDIRKIEVTQTQQSQQQAYRDAEGNSGSNWYYNEQNGSNEYYSSSNGGNSNSDSGSQQSSYQTEQDNSDQNYSNDKSVNVLI